MKICFLGDASSVHMHKWINYFKEENWDVYVISFKKYKIPNVHIISMDDEMNVREKGGNFRYLLFINKINKLIKSIDPDIVNAHYITSYGFIGALTKKKKLVLSAWGTDILVTPKKNWIYKLITKYSLKKADLITSDSNNMTNEIIELLGNCKKDVRTIPMGVNIDLFKTDRKENAGELKILSLRTLNENSNIITIIRGFKKVLQKYPYAELIIGNSGPMSDEIRSLCEDLKIMNSVKFLGFVGRNEIIQLMKECNYYMSIPTSDATSVTLLEAMASGIYPIVSDIPANREWICDGKNGSIVDIDESEMFNAIDAVHHKSDYKKKSQDINLNLIYEKADLRANMKSISNFFISLIENE